MTVRKAGRPKGAPNRKRLPSTEEIVRLSKQNFELTLKEIYNILLDNPEEGKKYTDKQREMALRLAADLGKHFVTLELSKGIDAKPKEEVKPEQKETPKAGNVVPLSLKPFSASK